MSSREPGTAWMGHLTVGMLVLVGLGGCGPRYALHGGEGVVAAKAGAAPNEMRSSPGTPPRASVTATGLHGPEDLDFLKDLPPLETLQVAATRLDDLGFLASHPELRHVHLEIDAGERFSSLDELTALPHLSSLSICAYGHRLGDLMQRLPALGVRRLSLTASSCTQCDLRPLGRHERLRDLVIYGDPVRVPEGTTTRHAIDSISLGGAEALSLSALFVVHPRIEGVEHLLGSKIRRLGLFGSFILGAAPRGDSSSRAGDHESPGLLRHVRRIWAHREHAAGGASDLSAIGGMSELREVSITSIHAPIESDLSILDPLPLESARVVGSARGASAGPRRPCRTYLYALDEGDGLGRTACPAECEACVDVPEPPAQHELFPIGCLQAHRPSEVAPDAEPRAKRFRE